MSAPVYRVFVLLFATIAAIEASGASWHPCSAQEELIDRPEPLPLDDLETDLNEDGIPDGWYNALDIKRINTGGPVGPHFIRFECSQRGRPARLSRAFGVDGRKIEAIVLGLWVRASNIQSGEREGDDPQLMIDFLGVQLHQLSRGLLGPWSRLPRDRWTRVAKRIAVPPGARDAIMSIGLMGATGTLDFDGLTLDLIPVGGAPTTNLVVNGGFELGDPGPASWLVDNDARRVFPGANKSTAAAELYAPRSRLLTGLALPVDGIGALDVSMAVRYSGLRGAGGARAALFFLDESGRAVAGHEGGDYFRDWAGSTNGWEAQEDRVPIPDGATRAVLQFEKPEQPGWIRFDNVQVTAAPDAAAASWVPYHVADDTDRWLPMPPSPSIEPASALDVAFLLRAPAGQRGFVGVKEGRLAFNGGERARFFGVSLIPPAAFQVPEHADLLADRLARSGVNLVRLAELDTAYGPNRSLFDDTRDDTRAFDPEALARLDHLIAALKSRGIYVALELAAKRRFRGEDGVPTPGALPVGGGPASMFDPTIGALALEAALSLLNHVNPETGLALKDDPVLAWVTQTGEVSMFNLIGAPETLPQPFAKNLQAIAEKSTGGSGRRFWEKVESAHEREMADALRKDGLRVPIAGVSHWRREAEFNAAQATKGLDLIDDRQYWAPSPPPFRAPLRRSMLWSTPETSLSGTGAIKRRPDRPFVLGYWCNLSSAWSTPEEGADHILGVFLAQAADWDAIVRRGIFIFPQTWGEGPVGTRGGEDIFQIAQVVNGSPHIYGLWPHAASLFQRGARLKSDTEKKPGSGRSGTRARGRSASAWDNTRGRLVVDTPYTQGIAGWFDDKAVSLAQLDVSTQNDFAVVLATSVSDEPIASTKRLLVSALARVEPTGFRWVDGWKREVADPGRPPFLQEPVIATVVWRRPGKIRAFALDNTGARIKEVTLETAPGRDGVMLEIDGKTPAFHWELVVE